MEADLLVLGDYLKSVEFLGRDVTMTIKEVVLEEFESMKAADKKQTKKGVVHFVERPRPWILNRTNVEALKAMWGSETKAWHGKRITLYPERVMNPATKTMGTAIRVRGSPDLERDVTFQLVLHRKKPQKVTLLRTGQKAAPKPSSPPPAAQPEPPSDSFDGRYPPDDGPAYAVWRQDGSLGAKP